MQYSTSRKTKIHKNIADFKLCFRILIRTKQMTRNHSKNKAINNFKTRAIIFQEDPMK